jgi:segregation and condensation protein A
MSDEVQEQQVDEAGHGLSLQLPRFSGPLDLLLHLIRKNRVSIYDIPIAMICDQYHEHLQAMQELDLEVAGELLWMAAWLLHLKSRELLPRARTEEEGDPREELVQRLLEYRRVKEVASYLYDIDVVRRCLWPPDVAPDLGDEEPELDWEDVDLRMLASLYLRAMQRFEASHPPPLRVVPLRFRVEEKMKELYERVRQEKMVALLRHLHGRSDTEEVVTLVVATLELVRLGGVLAEQRRSFAEIYLRPGFRELDTEALLRQAELDDEKVASGIASGAPVEQTGVDSAREDGGGRSAG